MNVQPRMRPCYLAPRIWKNKWKSREKCQKCICSEYVYIISFARCAAKVSATLSKIPLVHARRLVYRWADRETRSALGLGDKLCELCARAKYIYTGRHSDANSNRIFIFMVIGMCALALKSAMGSVFRIKGVFKTKSSGDVIIFLGENIIQTRVQTFCNWRLFFVVWKWRLLEKKLDMNRRLWVHLYT